MGHGDRVGLVGGERRSRRRDPELGAEGIHRSLVGGSVDEPGRLGREAVRVGERVPAALEEEHVLVADRDQYRPVSDPPGQGAKVLHPFLVGGGARTNEAAPAVAGNDGRSPAVVEHRVDRDPDRAEAAGRGDPSVSERVRGLLQGDDRDRGVEDAVELVAASTHRERSISIAAVTAYESSRSSTCESTNSRS